MDSWHNLCDRGLISSPLNISFLIGNLGLLSQPPASLKADMNKVWGGVGRKEAGDQNLLEHVGLTIWEAERDTQQVQAGSGGGCQLGQEDVHPYPSWGVLHPVNTPTPRLARWL